MEPLVAARVARQEGLEDFRLVVNRGACAGQTVFHLHVHVIPRVAGDGFVFPWPHTDGDLAEIEGHAARLRTAL